MALGSWLLALGLCASSSKFKVISPFWCVTGSRIRRRSDELCRWTRSTFHRRRMVGRSRRHHCNRLATPKPSSTDRRCTGRCGCAVNCGATLVFVGQPLGVVCQRHYQAQSPEPRAQSPEPRAQSPKPKAQSPKPKAQSPKPIPPPSVFPSPCTSPAHGSSARTRRDASGRVRTRGRNVAHRLRRRTGTPTAARASAGFRAWSG